MRIRPLADRVVVTRVPPKTMTAGGLHIPESSQEKTYEGHVTAIGPKCRTLEVGDKILYDRYAGTEAKSGDETWVVLREYDAQAVLA